MDSIPPDYESYDYRKEWEGKTLNDLSEKAILRSWFSKGGSCLELGGGFGRITKLLEQNFDSVTMLDYSQRNLRNAKLVLSEERTKLIRTDIKHIPAKNDVFDFIVMIRISHHLAKPSIVLNEICRVAKEGAGVIISIPNPFRSERINTSESTIIGSGSFGHAIYSTPRAAFSNPSLELKEQRGTGAFDNFIGKKLGSIRQLYLLDVLTSAAWMLKKTVFLHFVVRKNQ